MVLKGSEKLKTYTIEEAAKVLHLKPPTIRKHIKNGNIKAKKLENICRWIITEDEINRLLGLEGGKKGDDNKY